MEKGQERMRLMCDFRDGFKLCSCLEDDSDGKYIWQLRRLDREEYVQGRCHFPIEDFGNGLEFEWIKLNLEDHNCFDFEYMPKDGDNLIIRQKDSHFPFISLMYKGTEWEDDFYDELGQITRVFFQGVVKML